MHESTSTGDEYVFLLLGNFFGSKILNKVSLNNKENNEGKVKLETVKS